MKKALAALIALALPAAALAEGASGFYVQADAAHAKASSSLGSAKGFSPRISAGYRINDLRFAVDYTRYKNYKQAPSTDFKLYSIGASVIYDFDTQSPVKPYFGARLSLNRASAHLGGSDSFSKTSAGLGVLAGVSYAVTPNVDLDAGSATTTSAKSTLSKTSVPANCPPACASNSDIRVIPQTAEPSAVFCFRHIYRLKLHKPAVLYDNPERCGFCRPIF